MSRSRIWDCCWPSPWDCATLVDDCINDRPGAAVRLIRRFDGFVKSIVRKSLGSRRRSDWEDVEQEAWIRIFRGIPAWDGRGRFCAYVAVITHRAVIDYPPDRPHPASGRGEPVDPSPGPLESVIRGEELHRASAQARRFRDSLPCRLRDTWRLHAEGFKAEGIGEKLDVKARMIQLRLSQIAGGLTEALGRPAVEAPVVRRCLCEIYRLLEELGGGNV
ncbi:hypothetical protein LCGC14_2569380 [marine sediment metagenome]|uniref:RNA polymerase sigma-70 region 2 domain-containing protein n=1 Tax=marine sediment metagenome TaxID=412755 RepID=A0A0F9CTQ4_9ZZZZ